MAELDITAVLADADGDPVLTIAPDNPATYTVQGYTPVEESRRRAVVTSPDMDGAVELSSVLDEGVVALVVRCRGTSWAAVWAARSALRAAATARSWQLQVEAEGVTTTWSCRAANVSNPDALDPAKVRAGWLDVTLAIPVHPIPDES